MSAKIYAISDHSASHAPKLDYLNELSGGDQSFISEIIEMFITDAPQSVENAFRFLQEKNYQMLKLTVHKLKSSVQVVGGYHLAHLIQEIENASNENIKTDILHQMLSQLNTGIVHIVTHLNELLKSSFVRTANAA